MKNYFLFVMLVFFSSCSSNQTGTESNLLEPLAYYDKMHDLGNLRLIDVRTPDEFAEGHLQLAENIDFNGDSFAIKMNLLDKEDPIMVYCQAGGRSKKAAEAFRKAGFTRVYDLKGGMLAWKKEKLPTSNPPKEEYFSEDFDQLLSKHDRVIIDFYAHWCGPCRTIAPMLDELAKEFEGKVHYEKINVDYISADLANELGIDQIPIVAAFSKGKELERLVGDEHSKEEFRELFRLLK